MDVVGQMGSGPKFNLTTHSGVVETAAIHLKSLTRYLNNNCGVSVSHKSVEHGHETHGHRTTSSSGHGQETKGIERLLDVEAEYLW